MKRSFIAAPATPLLQFLFAALLSLLLSVTSLQAQVVSFNYSQLHGENLTNPTSLQFGPDGRLYVAQQNGAIVVYTIEKLAPNNYQVQSWESINLIQSIPNHNDDGQVNLAVHGRQVTGILVVGTPTNPVIYVTSSDPRIGAGKQLVNTNLDTNSGIISRLTWNGSEWVKLDLVIGLPRSEENHSLNGLTIDPATNVLYVAQGSNTNMGAPSDFFLNLPEYAYSTAILSVDLDAIGETPYILPTLDDEDRTNVLNPSPGFEDLNDPYGGNDGKNQAMLVAGGPVQIYSPGFRNNFDVVITKKGKMFSFDNGSNAQWGGPPINGTNQPNNNSPDTHWDVLFHVPGPGFYAGHPNPTRGNRANTFNASNPQSPVPVGMENVVERNWVPGPGSGPYAATIKQGQLASLSSSTNGLCEYTASNFGGAMKGDLVAASFNIGQIVRYNLDTAGTHLEPGGKTTLGSGFGYQQNPQPLDVTAQGDNQVFPGTVWCTMWGTGDIIILEPLDAPTCLGSSTSDHEDSDGDGYTNFDETSNGTDYCSPASQPKDFDRDLRSDKNDPDDDNDGILDVNDRFPLDASNGMNTPIPFALEFDNSADGGIENWGFTGLMANGVANYDTLFNTADMTVGGASLKFTVDAVSEGEAWQNINSQKNAFQFGVNMSNTNWNYIVQTRVMSPFSGVTNLTNHASMGMFIGTGDQENFLRVVCHANNGAGGIQVMKEVTGGTVTNTMNAAPILNKSYVDLFLKINTTTFMAEATYSIDGGMQLPLAAPVSIPPAWITQKALAVGIISSSYGPATTFPATWDFIKVYYDQSSVTGQWHTINSAITPVVRHECSYVGAGDNFYLMGGRSVSSSVHKPVQCYHPHDSTWSTRSAPPVEIHHFQAVEYNGLIYAICAFTGDYPFETPLPNIYIYDPVGDTWTVGPLIPAARRRGSAGCVVYNNKIYVVCGIKNGHTDGWVNWLDVYDPIANTWTVLPDAPRERDHFSVALVDDNIYCVGGRKTNLAGGNQFWTGVVPQVDVYDISSNTWRTLPSPASDLPIPRAAASVAVVGNEILVIGGESPASTQAHDETHALNFITETWREVASLNQGRHGTQAVVNNGNVYVACGSKVRGNNGSSELGSQEVFYFFNQNAPTGNAIVKGNIVPSTTNKNFSLVLLADPKTSTINLTNQNGNQVLVVDQIQLSDTTNYKITNFPNLPISIAPNSFFTLNLKFQPLSLGVKDAFIHVEHTGANGPVNITLTGECVETIPCEEHPTEQNGLLIVELENVLPRPAAWPTRTVHNGYTGTGFIRYEGPEYFSNPGNNMFTIKVNISNPGRYRFQQRSWNDSTVANYNNDYFIKFPHTLIAGGGNTWKYKYGDNKGVMAPDNPNGWIKVYQNRSRIWTYDTWIVEELPHELYVDFPAPGLYEILVSGRDNGISLDRFVFYKDPVTETQATTAQPIASPITCIEIPWYADNDGDLYGNPNDHVMSIVKPVGYVLNNKDCNDANNLINPAGTEVQDGIDNNCNGVIDEGFGNPKALLVVGSPVLSPNDLAIKERITELGYDVTVMTGPDATTLAGEAMNLIFISASVNSNDVLTKFTHVDVPVINCEPNLSDDLKMTNVSASNPYFGTVNGSQLKIKGAPHPLKGTLTNGTHTVYTGTNKLVWGKPEAAATIIATDVTDTTKIVIYGYDINAQMYTLKAPARRVGFFLNDASAQALNASGLELLDAALRWATNYNTIGDVTIGEALFVVGSISPISASDLAFKTRLEGLGFDVTAIAAQGSQTSDATGKDLIVISSTVSANNVTTKFTNLAIPLMNWEPSLMDDLRLTSTSSGSSTYRNTLISIVGVGATHPLGAGLPLGQVAVYTINGNITQSTSYNTSTAYRIAGASGVNSNTTIFGYEKGVMMQQNLVAPERRVAFFANDTSGIQMNATGWILFDASIRWLTAGLNTPPAFNISGNVTADEDFTGSKTVNVTALPPVLGEEGQVPTYSLSPASVSFANVSFNTATGKVTITSKPDEFGFQEFTITANDGQANNNTYTQTFTLTINPVNDPPTFNVSGNITVLKNFATVPTVTVTPTPIPVNEQVQNVIYSLSPSSVPFANISLNNATGQVTITSLPEQTGFQIFTLTANDGQNQFNTATKQFYLAVNNPTSNAICINCGGSQFVSVTGDTFKTDNYFSGGTLTYTNPGVTEILNTFDDDVFKTERNAAAFSYNIPVGNGVYKVRLYFAETYFGATGGSATGGAGSRVFHVNLEGSQVLSYFDIFAQAGGAERAIMREFSGVAVSDGMLNLSLGSVVNKAKISGICIIPDGTANNPPAFSLSGNIAVTKDFTGTRSVTVTPDPVPTGEQGQVVTYSLSPSTVAFANIAFNSSTGKVDVTAVPGASGFQQFTLTANDGQPINNTVSKTFYLAVNETRSKAMCWNCGGPQYVSVVGDTFKSDFFFEGGAFTFTSPNTNDIVNTFDDVLFKSERNGGTVRYNIPAANGLYKVKLLFAETHFGAVGGAAGGIGSRVFNVSIEGNQVLTNYDIFAKAGGADRAVTETFDSLNITDGVIDIDLDVVANKAKISGICVIPYTTNEPPTFTVSTPVLTLAEDFAGTQTVTMIPDPVLPADAGDVVTYSLSPAGTGIASVSIDPATGTISITKLNNKNGSQVFTVTANDGKPFGIASRSFTLNVTPVNDPPLFTLNQNIVLVKNFSPPVAVQVTPAPVPADEANQVVTYSLSPPTASFANVSINQATGEVTFASINNAYGTQQFSIFADDGQSVNNMTSQIFTLTVNQLGPNDPRPKFINCGNGAQYISLAGDTFKTDNFFSTGAQPFTNNSIPDILNTGDDMIYRSERYAGLLTYAIPVVNGAYNITLHFAELYYGSTGGQPAQGGAGKRVFNVDLEGTRVLTNFDAIVAAGGSERAHTETFSNIQITDGFVNLQFTAVYGNAKVNAISIVPITVDCNGTQGGLATTNECGFCTGGTTGLLPNHGKDCAGVCGGTATLNACNICVGGTTGIDANQGKDCAGVCNGTAYLNECNICVGGTTGLGANQGKDCAGICGGAATLNSCGICTGGTTGVPATQGKDCAGVCNGTAFLDDCGVCSGGTSGHVANSNKDACGVCFGNGSTCQPTCVANEVVSFTLMYAGTAGEIGPLTSGMVLNKATLGSFSIRANTCNGQNVGSVKFVLNGSTFKTETAPPYALNGDNNGSYTAWNPAVGSYTLVGIPYTGASGTGTVGVSETVTFTVINQVNQAPDCAGVPGGTATLNSCNICTGGTTGLPATQGKDCAGVCGGTATLNECGICTGGTTGLPATQGKDCAGVCNGTAFLDDCGICSGGTSGHTANSDKDQCGVCFGNGSGCTPVPDCAGVPGGTAFLDDCGICSGGTTGHVANSDKDNCGVCFGQGLCCQNDGDCNDNSACTIDACVQNLCTHQQITGASYLKVVNAQKSWKKLKLGYSTTSLFTPKQNVSAGGNNQICITLRDAQGNAEWTKIQLRPQGNSGAAVALSGYVPAQPGTGWFTICIPLSAFPAVDFSQLSYMELPYSNGANPFELHIQKIEFKGGASPFLWFGDTKTDNYHDGSSTGSFTAVVVAGTPCQTSGGTDCAGVANGTAFLNTCGICVGGNTGLAANAGQDCNGTCNGTAYLNTCGICVGGNTGLGANQGKDCAGVCGGTALPDDCGICSGGTSGHVANSDKDICGVCFGNGQCSTTCTPVSITSLSLMGICTSGVIGEITDGMVISLAQTPDFAVRANVCDEAAVKSVRFIVNGSTFRTENSAPYSINGEQPAGCFKKWYVGAIPYTLTVVAYSGLNGTGTASAPFTRQFTVVNGNAKMSEEEPAMNDEQQLSLYPNPNTGKFTVEFYTEEVQDVTMKIFNHLGQVVYEINRPEFVGELQEQIDLDSHPTGMYFMQMQHGGTSIIKKVIIKD